MPFSLEREQCVCWCDSAHQSDNLLKDAPGRILGYFIREHMPSDMVSNFCFYICMLCSFTLLGCGSFVLVQIY